MMTKENNLEDLRFSIVVIHRNGCENLHKLIDSLAPQITKDEIIIVDNNSNDDSIKYIQSIEQFSYLNIKFIMNNCNLGYGSACNKAMNKAKGSYFLLCNNDIYLENNTLDKFYSRLESDKSAGIIGPQLYSNSGNQINSYSTIIPTFLNQIDLIGRFFKSKKIDKYSPVFHLRGACLAVSRDMFNEIGGYDEDFYFYHEETEWCFRINKTKKWKVMFDPETKVYHSEGKSTKKIFLPSRVEFYRSRILFWKKIFPRHIFYLIYFWNNFKLLIDLIYYFLFSLLTVFAYRKITNKFLDRFIVLAWLIFGQPESWGLPDKCAKK